MSWRTPTSLTSLFCEENRLTATWGPVTSDAG